MNMEIFLLHVLFFCIHKTLGNFILRKENVTSLNGGTEKFRDFCGVFREIPAEILRNYYKIRNF